MKYIVEAIHRELDEDILDMMHATGDEQLHMLLMQLQTLRILKKINKKLSHPTHFSSPL